MLAATVDSSVHFYWHWRDCVTYTLYSVVPVTPVTPAHDWHDPAERKEVPKYDTNMTNLCQH